MTIPSWAKPGAKCVCVDDSPGVSDGPKLTIGQTYTIRDAYWSPAFGRLHVRLCELKGRVSFYRGLGIAEGGYRVDRFRPLVSRTQEQDVALFTHLLDGLPVREGAQ